MQSWEEWLKKYGDHVSLGNSKRLSEEVNSSFPEEVAISQQYKERFSIGTSDQPKQVAFNKEYGVVLVSCMKGKVLQIFSVLDGFKLANQFDFNYQCVEVATEDNLCFVTLSDFSHVHSKHNYLVIINLETMRILSTVRTDGWWSKFIKLYSEEQIAFVSNWKSNDITIVSYEDTQNPIVTQIIPCGISPRGIDVTPSGNLVLVACYYSRNIIELRKKAELYGVSYLGKPFDFPRYSGNMRDIVIKDDLAYVSNMGRSLIHTYSIKERSFVDTWSVGKFPNSLRVVSDNALVVNCRGDNSIYLFDRNASRLERVATSLSGPTGLCVTEGGFFATGFDNNTLSYFE